MRAFSLRRSLSVVLWAALVVACEPSTGGGDNTGGGPATLTPDAGTPAGDGAVACLGECAPGTRQCGADGALQICADYDGDGCNDWGGDLACPAGSSCVDGACAAACPNACVAGEAVCAADGRRECVVVNPDGCTEFGPATPCAAGERCDGGQCVPEGQACADACATDGLRACEGDAYRSCGQHDEDPCLDWSPTVSCGLVEACVGAGECVPDCADECEGGTTTCVGAGVAVCGNFDRDACLELGPPSPCRADERCDAGACVPADQPCEVECLQADARLCADGISFRQCGQYDVDACLELSAPVRCGAAEICSDGECVRVCDDECVDGGRQCLADGASVCGNFDADPCLEWSAPTACAEGERCDDGDCVEAAAPCEDACVAGEQLCGAGGVLRCANYDDDACVEWGPEMPCAAGQRCEGAGLCVDDCADECAADTRDCRAGGVVTCGEFDGDACLEFGPAEACPADQNCSGGACRDVCVDDCPLEGARACTPAGEVQTCGHYDAEICLEWSSPVPCAANQACVDGACVVVCQDECQADERRCVGSAYEVCANFDPDDCLEFGGGGACGAGEVCAMGACQVDCSDECAAGTGECLDDGARTCGNFDGDACLEWGAPQACDAWQTCDAGACVARPVPTGVVINEVFYDADGVADREQAFIELHGPAGTSLTGFTLVGVNGNGGADYVTLELAGTLGADGFYVVAHPDAVALAEVVDQVESGADLQNGPDSVQLRWGETVVDALAYGAFGAGETAAGEGAPAAGAAPGESLTRDARQTDTGDNRTDFRAGVPSPGSALPCQDTCPRDGDVQCADGAAERCAPAGAGCLAWTVTADCTGAGELCVDGACEPAPQCVVPTGIVRMNPINGVFAQHPCIDVLPLAGAGFAVVGGAPQTTLKFALTDIDGSPTTPVQTFGPTNVAPWGGAGADTYYPKLATDGQQYLVTWSGFSNQGNRDILLRRLTLQGQLIAVNNAVISQGTKGFAPAFLARAGGFDVIFNAYRQWRRIPLSALGEPSPLVDVGVAHGDTREETFMAQARTDAGTRGMLYAVNTVDFGSPKAFFQRLDANGAAAGNRVELGTSTLASGFPGAYLFALPGDRFGAIWRTVVGVATPTQSLVYAVLNANGVVQSSVVLNELDPPVAYRPNIVPVSAFFDGDRIGVVHERYFDQLEPRHTMIQWLSPAGAHIARTELGNVKGVLVKHPDDGLFRLFEHRGTQTPIAVHVLGCP